MSDDIDLLFGGGGGLLDMFDVDMVMIFKHYAT